MFKTLYSLKSQYLYLGLIFLMSVILSLNGNLIAAGISAAVGGAFYALVSFSDCSKKYLIILPFLSILTVWFLTADGFKSFISLSYLPVGFTVAYSVSRQKSKSQAIIISALSLGALYLAIYAAHIIYAYGHLSVDSIKAYAELFFIKVSSLFKEANKAFVLSDGKNLYSEEDISGLMILSYFSNLIFKISVSGLSCESALIDKVKNSKLVLSKQAAIIYILMYVITFLSGSLPPYMLVTVQTFTFPLQIGLIYMGAIVLLDRLKSGKLSIFSIILIAAVSLFVFGSFVSVLMILMSFS